MSVIATLLGTRANHESAGQRRPQRTRVQSNRLSSRVATRRGHSSVNSLELLEARTLLAADLLISEVQLSTSDTDQYFELKGEANATINAGTYFVAIDGDHDFSRAGEITSIFDLSGLTLGANGYLVFAQADHPYAFNSDATVIVGTDGFQVPSNRFSDDSSISNRFEFLEDSISFLLIESATPPTITDADTDDDGVLDIPGWTVLDSVAVLGAHLGGSVNDIAYSDVVFHAYGNQSPVAVGTTEFTSDRFIEYVARVGDSNGSEVDDWYGGWVIDGALSHGSIGAVPELYSSAPIDHVGGPNFMSTVTGTVFEDTNGNSVQDGAEVGVAGVKAFLDRDRNGSHSVFRTVAEPDAAVDGQDLTFFYPGVRLGSADASNELTFGDIEATFDSDDALTGDKVFSDNGFRYFDDARRLRMDFFSPVYQVNLDTRPTSFLSELSVAVLEVFDADGNLLERYDTTNLNFETTTLTITRPTPDIAYAVAYGVRAGGIDWVTFDNLSFRQPEEYAVTDADGEFQIKRIPRDITAGSYQVRIEGAAGFATASLNGPTNVRDVDYSVATGFLPGAFSFPSAPKPTIVINGVSTTAVGNPEDAFAVVGRQDGVWWIARSTGTEFVNEPLGQWATSVNWLDARVGDFNGDGQDDIFGRAANGSLWVSLSTGDGLLNDRWGSWATGVDYQDVTVGDFNGDGYDDIAARANGAWNVSLSNGSGFTTTVWSAWSDAVDWKGIQVGDFDGDGRDDVVGRAGAAWWVGLSDGLSFDNQRWTVWSPRVTWSDYLVGDFNGDGRDDIAGRARGVWYVGVAGDHRFNTTAWGRWSTSVKWTNVSVGDFNADGRADIVGMAGTNWWVARSADGVFASRRWGSWEPGQWDNIFFADFNGDGKTDIVGRKQSTWRVLKATQAGFVDERWGSWSADLDWDDVMIGRFGSASEALADALDADSIEVQFPFPTEGAVDGIVRA